MWTTDGRRISDDNPLLLANRRAKRLATLLKRQPSVVKGRLRLPFVTPLIFLSAVQMRCKLTDATRASVYLRGRPGSDNDDGIVPQADMLATTRDQRLRESAAHHWFSPVMAATILRMTGVASSTMGRTATHDSSHDRNQAPRNVPRESEECAIAAATADVNPDWITPKMSGP